MGGQVSDLAGEGAGLNAGAFMVQAAEEGLGVVAARDAMRAGGLSMSNATFSRMYGEVRNTIANRDVIAGLDYGAIPPGDAYSTWTMGAGGDYATFVTSYVRAPGQAEVEERFFTFVTSDPHTPQEAIDAAADHYSNDAPMNDTFKSIYQGSMVTSMTRTRGGD